MILNLLRSFFKPAPPKFKAGDLVMFEAADIDYTARVISFDTSAEIIALEIIDKVKAAKDTWPVGAKITLRHGHLSYRTLIKVGEGAYQETDKG